MVHFPASRFAAVCILSSSLVLAPSTRAQTAPRVSYSSVRHDHTHALAQSVTGSAKAVAGLGENRRPLSLAVASLAHAGVEDLVTGYATATGGALLLQRGVPEAIAPGSQRAGLLAAGGFVAPFQTAAAAIELPIRPDFLLAEDVRGIGHADLLTAQRGSDTVYYLRSREDGTLAAASAITLRGSLNAFTTWRSASGTVVVVAAIRAARSGLQFLSLDGTETAFVPLEGLVTTIERARLNQHGVDDLLITVGGRALVLDGASAATGKPVFETLPASGALAATSGSFLYDKRAFGQVAVLSSDGAMHLFTRVALDSSEMTQAEKALLRAHRTSLPAALLPHGEPSALTWNEAETVPGFGATGNSRPILLHGRLTVGSSGDDLAVLSGGKYFELTHSIQTSNGQRSSTPTLVIDAISADVASAAVLARVSADSRLGVITAASTAHPLVSVPATLNTYYVNTTLDGNNDGQNGNGKATCSNGSATPCSLRDAVRLANGDSPQTSVNSVDVIVVPAGTTYLNATNANVNGGSTTNLNGDRNYHYDLETNVNIIGSGACTKNSAGVVTGCGSIIDAQHNDKIFNANSGNVNGVGTFAIFMSNLQLQNGTTPSSNGYDTAGGLISIDTNGPGTLTLNNMLLTKGTVVGDSGGAVVMYNSNSAIVGGIEIDNSSITYNTAIGPGAHGGDANGGGISTVYSEAVKMTNDIVSYNSSGHFGGGLYINVDSGVVDKNLTSVTVNNNTSLQDGGGIYGGNFGIGANLTLNANTVSGSTNVGGGLYLFTQFDPVAITYSNISGNNLSGNTSAGGAGIYVTGDVSSPVSQSIQYSRIVGNTGGLANQTGLALGGGGSSSGMLTATENWWGCNNDPQSSGSGCNQAYSNFANPNQLLTTPFTTLTVAMNAVTPGTVAALNVTGSLAQDSSGTTYSASQNAVFSGLPITEQVLVSGSGTTVNGTLNSSAQLATLGLGSSNANDTGTPIAKVDNYQVAPPMIQQAFGAASIATGSATTLTYTLTNLNSAPIKSLGFTNSLPGGLILTTPAASTTCSNASLSAPASSATVVLSGATQVASTGSPVSCTVTVNVMSPNAGNVTNAVSATAAIPGLGIISGNTATQALKIVSAAIVAVKAVYTTPPAATLTAGGNAGSITVALEDASNHIATTATGVAVLLSVNGPNAYSQTYTASTTSGTATFDLSSVPLTAAGAYTITASSAGLASAAATENVTPGPMSVLSVTGFPSSISAQLAGSGNIKASDIYGNTATGFTGTVTITTTDPSATISPATYTYSSADAGSHAFSVTFTVAGSHTITATSSPSLGSQTGIVVGDALWVLASTGLRSAITESGTDLVSANGASGAASTFGSLAVDASGNIWSVGSATNALAFSTYTGASVNSYVGAGLSNPASVAVDGLGYVWIANSGSYTVSEFSPFGAALSPSTGYSTTAGTAASTTSPVSIAIDISGNIWTVNAANSTITRMLGAAAPVVSPISLALKTNTQGTEP